MSGEEYGAPKDSVAHTPDADEEDSYLPAFIQAVNQMRLEGNHCDVRLKIDSTEILAHRLVLCAASPVFKAMFSGDWPKEGAEEVYLDVKAEVMQLIVNYVYSGEIQLTKDNVESVLVSANLYQICSLKEICCSFLSAMLDACNCVGIFSIADTLKCSKLRQDSLEFILKYFEEVVLFDELSKLPLNLLVVIISSDDLNVVNEEVPFKAVVKWVQYKSERKSVIDKALEHVRLPFLSGTFLYKSVRTLDVVEASSASCALVDEAVWYQIVSQTERSSMQTSRTVPRASYKNPTLVGVQQTGQYTTAAKDIVVYEVSTATWTERLPFPIALLGGFAVAKLHGIMYVAGGFEPSYRDEVHKMKLCWKFTERDRWTQLAGMQNSRANFTLLACGCFLYAIGGDATEQATIERYTPSLNIWEVVDEVPF